MLKLIIKKTCFETEVKRVRSREGAVEENGMLDLRVEWVIRRR